MIDVDPATNRIGRMHKIAGIVPSPNGRLLLNEDVYAGEVSWRPISIYALKRQTWKRPTGSYSACWLADGRRVASLRYVEDKQAQLTISNTDRPGLHSDQLVDRTVNGQLPYLLGAWGQNEVATIRWLKDALSEHEIAVYSVAPKITLLRKIHATLPFDLSGNPPAYCAQSHRLAWRINRSAENSPWGKILGRILRRPESPHQELWVSEADGTQLRHIGDLENSNDKRQIDAVQWLPDGKRLSVLIGDTIWVVPAE
jgi:hypothetical protein